MSTALGQLREALGEVDDLRRAAFVLEWDLETYMPAGGVEDRARQLATLQAAAHERFVSEKMVRLLEAAEAQVQGLDYDSDDASLVRVTRRDRDLAARLPKELVAEAAEAGASARPVWREARARSDWSMFEPCMRRSVELGRRIAEATGYGERPFDALLARMEPGLSAAQLESFFGELKQAIVPLVRRIAERADCVDDRVLDRELDTDRQLAFSLTVVQRLGFDLQRGRQDLSAHPFCVPFGPGDVRITTRVRSSFRNSCLYSSIHEGGHAMYNQGIPKRLARTPLWAGASPGVHESQSRLWENLVGRSRTFWAYLFPELRAAFPEQLADVDAEDLYRAVNCVQPSYIRVDADELTYNLHILLRFEIENELHEGRLRVEEVPAAWNARLEAYLGLPPPPAAQGPLQDVHWSEPVVGEFVSYTLGNLIGAQLMEKVRADLPELDEQMSRGEFSPLLGWLQERLYVHGRKFTPGELVLRATERPITTAPWIAYAQAKFAELYGLEQPTGPSVQS